ncbi:unnamed protein product [Cylicocyclus nassatus]|uniref:Acid phosphatase n=1 Tax=Cylicocyclus nassatus TaxID=53992 RepID=A0AA36H561_CYLNA|nr:unnamed protein product [Cylicocyclus nassatus]
MTRFLILTSFVNCVYAKLIFVVGIYAHGDTAPVYIPYPNDVNDEISWPRGLGALTNKGIERMYKLGVWLRKRYIEDTIFLHPSKLQSQVTMQSANSPNTVESAQAVAAGLAPAEGQEVWTKGELRSWQPFYIETLADAAHDIILRPAMFPCPSIDGEIVDEWKIIKHNFEGKHRVLLEKFATLTGLSPFSFFMFGRLYGIQKEIEHGLPQPDWVNEIYEGKKLIDWIREAKTLSRLHPFNTKEKGRARGGALLNKIVEYLRNATYDIGGAKKAVFASTFDGTIAPLMYAMGIGNNQLVKSGSLLLMELHEKNEDFVVRIWWRNDTEHVQQLVLPSCDLDCPLDDFADNLRSMRLTEYDAKQICGCATSYVSRLSMITLFLLILFTV